MDFFSLYYDLKSSPTVAIFSVLMFFCTRVHVRTSMFILECFNYFGIRVGVAEALSFLHWDFSRLGVLPFC